MEWNGIHSQNLGVGAYMGMRLARGVHELVCVS